MARHYLTFDTDAHYDQVQARSLALTMSRATRESQRSNPISSHNPPSSASRDTDPKPENNNNNASRRRIAVACQRCRKRKIKCSGDIGNGQGCQNCRNAGSDPSTCQYLRVSSQAYATLLSPADWPYPVPNAPCVPPIASNGFYHSGSSPVPSFNASGYTGMARTRYSPSYSYQAIPNSPECYGSYPLPTSNEPLLEQQYNFHNGSQNNPIASNEVTHNPSSYGNSEHLRQWHSGATPGRPYHPNYDQGIPGSRYQQSSIILNNTTDAPVSTTDGTPLVSDLGALAISQSARDLPGGRILPNPRTSGITSCAQSRKASFITLTDPMQLSHGGDSSGSWVSEQTTACKNSNAVDSPLVTTNLDNSQTRKSPSLSPRFIPTLSPDFITGPQSESVIDSIDSSKIDFSLAGIGNVTPSLAGFISGDSTDNHQTGKASPRYRSIGALSYIPDVNLEHISPTAIEQISLDTQACQSFDKVPKTKFQIQG